MDVLLGALDDPDGFLRFKVVTAIEILRRDHPSLVLPARRPSRRWSLTERTRYYDYLTLRSQHRARDASGRPGRCWCARSTTSSSATLDRILSAAGADLSVEGHRRRAMPSSTAIAGHARGALEYLDNLLDGLDPARVMPIIEDMPDRGEGAARQRVLKTRRATSRTRWRSSCTTTTRSSRPPPSISSSSASSGRSPTISNSRWTHARATDWYVFEAASWALAARQPRGATLRISGSSRCPPSNWPTGSAHPALRFRLGRRAVPHCRAARQVRHEAGREILSRRSQPDDVHFLLEGSVHVSGGDGAPSAGRPRSPSRSYSKAARSATGAGGRSCDLPR